MIDAPQISCVPMLTVSELTPRTASDVGRELGRSVTAIKELARQIHAPVLRTASGIWLFPPVAVDKLRREIQRRELEGLRR
jgi:hypothetical protein